MVKNIISAHLAVSLLALGFFNSGCVTAPANQPATASPSSVTASARSPTPTAIVTMGNPTLATMSTARLARGSLAGKLLMRNFEVSAGTTATTHFMGVITVHLTSPVFGTQYVELNFYQPARTFAYYQDGRFHLGYGSEMFGAVHEMLRSERPVYFYFDEKVLQGIKPSDHSAYAEFGFLTTEARWPY